MIAFALLGFELYNISKRKDKEIVVNYTEISDIDYKVYLKKNNFFDTPYLEKNRTYIASLIDYILVDFDYSFNVSEEVSGSYTYYIEGRVSANKSNSSDDYWSKEYILSDKISKEYSNLKQISIKETTKIDYQFYNDLLNSFKNQYGVPINGMFTVFLVVENHIESDYVERDISKDSKIELNIPLTSLTIDVPIKTSELNNNGILINEVVEENILYYTIIKYISYACFLIVAIIMICVIVLMIVKSKYESKYHKSLRKILKTYDGILVNVNCLPNLEGLNIIDVENFLELIDAHSEIRKPISFKQDPDESIFLLINEGIAWRFIMKKKDFYRSKMVAK